MEVDFTRITRVTVVDDTGRVLERWQVDVEPSLQDDGRTLKLFLTYNPKKPKADRSWLPTQDPRVDKPLVHKGGRKNAPGH